MNNIEELLQGRVCECGKEHRCGIKHVVICEGAINRLGSLLENYNNVLLVADKNTYAVCGALTEQNIKNKFENKTVFEPDGVLIPDERAIDTLNAAVSDKTDLILGIGSGVIQDLCKYVSFKCGLPYYIVATAPSMDGYASSGAAMIINNMKITYTAHVPEAIIGDVDVLKNAPIEMIQAGYGDIIGKLSCLNDWRLSVAVNNEYFCRYVYDLTMDAVDSIKNEGKNLLNREPSAVKKLTDALVIVGIAMAYVGNSRPASGSEHHMSHFFEVTGIMENSEYLAHGIDVVFSAVNTSRIRKKIASLDIPKNKTNFSDICWESDIYKLYGKAADGVIDLQSKLSTYVNDKSEIYNSKWNEIREILDDAASAEEILHYIESVGLDYNLFLKTYGEDKIKAAELYSKDLKDRYTVLWLNYYLFYESKNNPKNKKLFLLDMDGTIYLGDNLFDGTADFLEYVKSIGGRYIFLTNNSSKSVNKYIDKLKSMGIDATRKDFLTSTDVMINHLKQQEYKKIYALGTESFKEQLKESGLCITDKIEDNIDCLCMGYDTELTYKKLEDACILLKNDIAYTATNPDWVCPTAYGYVPDCGSVSEMLFRATGKKPVFVGKPEPDMALLAAEITGFSKDETAILGDRLYTDIKCGANAGVTTVFMLSGEGTTEDIEKYCVMPDFIFKNIKEFYEYLKTEE